MHQILNGQLAELPSILDSLFTGAANITSTPIGMESGGVVGSHKVVGKGYVNAENSQFVSMVAYSTPHNT